MPFAFKREIKIPLLALLLLTGGWAQQDLGLPETARTLKADKKELSPVRSLACSADGSTVAAGGEDYALSVWDAERGARIQRIEAGQPQQCRSLAFTSEGLLISAGPLGLSLRDPGKPEPKQTWAASPVPARFALSRKGGRAAVSSSSGVRLIELPSGKELGSFPGRVSAAGSLVIDDAGARVYFVDEGDTIRSWDCGGHGTASWRFPEETIKSIALASEGTHLIAAGMKGSILEIDAGDGRLLRKWTVEAKEGKAPHLLAVAVVPSRHLIVAAGYDGGLHFRDLESGKPIGTASEAHRGWVTALAVSADGRRLVSGGEDGVLKIWSWDAK